MMMMNSSVRNATYNNNNNRNKTLIILCFMCLCVCVCGCVLLVTAYYMCIYTLHSLFVRLLACFCYTCICDVGATSGCSTNN